MVLRTQKENFCSVGEIHHQESKANEGRVWRCVYTLVPWNLIKTKARLGFNDWPANHKNIDRNQHCYAARFTNLRICHFWYIDDSKEEDGNGKQFSLSQATETNQKLMMYFINRRKMRSFFVSSALCKKGGKRSLDSWVDSTFFNNTSRWIP